MARCHCSCELLLRPLDCKWQKPNWSQFQQEDFVGKMLWYFPQLGLRDNQDQDPRSQVGGLHLSIYLQCFSVYPRALVSSNADQLLPDKGNAILKFSATSYSVTLSPQKEYPSPSGSIWEAPRKEWDELTLGSLKETRQVRCGDQLTPQSQSGEERRDYSLRRKQLDKQNSTYSYIHFRQL